MYQELTLLTMGIYILNIQVGIRGGFRQKRDDVLLANMVVH